MITAPTEAQPIEFNESSDKSEVAERAINLAETINKASEAELSCAQAIQSLEKVSKSLVSPENRAASKWHLENSRRSLNEASQAYQTELANLIGANYKELGPDFLGESYELYKALDDWKTQGTLESGRFTPQVLESLRGQYDPKNPEQVLRIGNFLVIPKNHPQLTLMIEGKVYVPDTQHREPYEPSPRSEGAPSAGRSSAPPPERVASPARVNRPFESIEEFRAIIRKKSAEKEAERIEELTESNRAYSKPVVKEWEIEIQKAVAGGNYDRAERLRQGAYQATFGRGFSYPGGERPTQAQLIEVYKKLAAEAQSDLAEEARKKAEEKKTELDERDKLRAENVRKPWSKPAETSTPTTSEAPTDAPSETEPIAPPSATETPDAKKAEQI